MDMNIRQIFGIVMVGLIVSCCIRFAKQTKSINKELNRMMAEKSEQKEKIKVIKSLLPSLCEGTKNDKYLLGVLLLILCFLIALLTLLFYNIVDSEIIQKISVSFAIFLGLFCFAFGIVKAKRFKNYIKKLFIQKYGSIKEDKAFQSLNSDQKNNFCFKVLKYECIVNNYTEKRVVRESHFSNGSTIKKVKNMFEYYYDLKALGVTNISSDILLDEIINDSIKELSKIKLINVKILGNYLLVSKMTVLHGYNEEDVALDISDVELFYNQIVKKILDNDIYIK